MDRMASLDLALKNEEAEAKFYANEAARSRNPLAKIMFQTLSKEEGEHMRRIRALHDRLVSSGDWPADVPLEVSDTNVKQVLEDMTATAGSAEKHNDDDVAAIRKAIAFESKGAKFYADLAAACTNPQEKRFFEFLSSIEREHHLSLTDSLTYLEDPDSFMMQRERSLLDG